MSRVGIPSEWMEIIYMILSELKGRDWVNTQLSCKLMASSVRPRDHFQRKSDRIENNLKFMVPLQFWFNYNPHLWLPVAYMPTANINNIPKIDDKES